MNQIFKIARNVKDGLKTTIIGIVLIGTSISSVFILEYSWTNILPGLGLGILLLCLPDKKEKK